MRIPVTLSRYVAREFIISLLVVFFAFGVLIMLMDTLEIIRRVQNKSISGFVLAQLVVFRFPLTGQKVLPFVVLIGTILTYTRLARRHELVVIRGAGVSAWQFLMPSIAVSFLLGVLMIVAINPLSCLMISQYEKMEAKYFQGKQSLMTLSKSGLWLKESTRNANNSNHQTPHDVSDIIIHAKEMGGRDKVELHNVIIFLLGENSTFIRRIDAPSALLQEGFWDLHDAVITDPDGSLQQHEQFSLETSITMQDIQQSFSSPETLSFWELPNFIETLNKSGFSDIAHRMQWHMILASPFLFMAMAYLAAVFSIHTSRQNTIGFLLSGGVFSGFIVYFMMNLVFSLGLSGSMPVIMAAWLPVALCLLMGVGALLHYEDG